MSRKNKKHEDDDGRTVADMNVEGMPWYTPSSGKQKKLDEEDKPTRKEFFAIMRAWFSAYGKHILAILLGMGLTVTLVYCWLNGWFID